MDDKLSDVLTIDELAAYLRNELIADLFFRLHKVERIGMGIRKMKEAIVAAGLREPTFQLDGFFRAIFHRSPEFALKEGMPRIGVRGFPIDRLAHRGIAPRQGQRLGPVEGFARQPRPFSVSAKANTCRAPIGGLYEP